MSTHYIGFYKEISKVISKLSTKVSGAKRLKRQEARICRCSENKGADLREHR